ncbi:MAG: cysteine desulfurase NifS [Planctomycetota bacterium]|jgi:cysteine desulfurase
MKRIYLDHNATTPVRPEVVEAMLPLLRETYGNPSSIHWFGQEAKRAMERAREQVADLIHAEPREIVFTSGGTEADNQAIRGALDHAKARGRHVVTTAVEHHAVLMTCEHVGKSGVDVTVLPVDETGRVDAEAVAGVLREDTVLVTVMLANNDVGTLQPVKKIARIARDRGVPVHTDAVQALGKIPVDAGDLGVDFLSLSGHKLYGPKGVGALYMRRGAKAASLLHGGHHERRRRAGTENVASIVGFGKACELAKAGLAEGAPDRLRELRDRLHGSICDRIPHVLLNGHPELRLPNTLNLSFLFVEGESLLMNLDVKGIAVSTGSACTSGTLEPSHVLMAMGRRPEEAHGSLRFSLGRDNTAEDMDATVDALVEVVEKLRAMSPLYDDFLAEQAGDSTGKP